MPLYEYLCSSCGHRFERIQKFSDPPVAECPSCGGKVDKLLSSPAIQFKGAGWYVNDYARAGKSDGGASRDRGSASTGPASEAKTEKPADTSPKPTPQTSDKS